MCKRCKKGSLLGMGILLWAINLFAQGPDTLWTRTYGGTDEDIGTSVQQTSDGGYIVVGYTGSFGAGGSDVYFIKTDINGDTLWTRTYGGIWNDAGYSVQQTSDGGYIIAGGTNSFGAGSYDIYLIKTDASGDTIWTKTYGGDDADIGYSVQETSDGGYVVVGYTESFGESRSDVYIIKTDAKGDMFWTWTYGGTNEDIGTSVQQTSDGGYIVVGETKSFGAGNKDVYIIKTDATGYIFWTKTYGGKGNDGASSVQQTSDGGYIVVGYTGSFGADEWDRDVYLIKTDATGDTLWTRTYGGTDVELGRSVQQTTDGGYIIAGRTESFGAGYYDVYLIKTAANGDIFWTNTYGGGMSDYGTSVQQASDGGCIIAGGTNSFCIGIWDVYLIKIKPLLKKLTSPNGGEVLVSNTIHHITWLPAGTDFDSYRLLYSLDDGETYPHIIANRISPNSGLYSWKVPEIDCNTCRVKVQIRDIKGNVVAEDESDSNFTIQSTGIEEKESLPKAFFISCCEPNPFSEKIVIRYRLPVKSVISLEICDITGRIVKTLTRTQNLKPGTYTLEWDGRDNSGERVSSGIYFLRFEAEGYKATRKLLIMR